MSESREAEAARIVTAAWEADPDWGAFVWLAMTTGPRRSELCALRWSDVELDEAVLTLRRSVYVDDDGQVVEKDTKTHQQRRVALFLGELSGCPSTPATRPRPTHHPPPPRPRGPPRARARRAWFRA